MIHSSLVDGTGTKQKARIDVDNALFTAKIPYPPLIQQKVKPFRQYITDDGTTSGSNDMGIDGSTTNQEFYIEADQFNDRYITSLNFIIGYGNSAQPYQFADGAALTNGIRIYYSTVTGDVDIHDGVKTNQDFFRLSFDMIPANWEVRGVNANNDYGYFINSNLQNMGLGTGIKLDRGTKQRLRVVIRDNVGANADSLNCIAYGFERFE